MRGKYLMCVFALAINVAYANERCEIKSIKSFYEYLNKQGPTLNLANKRKDQFASEVELAKQRPNPEVDLDYLKGDQFGLDQNTAALSIKHTIEFGSKREKRISKANAYSGLNSTQTDLSLYEANVDAAIAYQKIAQLQILINSVKEASVTFDKLVKKLASRKQLNPEEIVSLSTLRLASNEYKAQLNEIENERLLLLGKISFLTKCNSPRINYYRLSFPNFLSNQEQRNDSGLLQMEDLKVKLAIQELELQRSLGYSNIQLGPVVEYETQGRDEFVSVGIAITFDLPILQTNTGGKLKALKELEAQTIESSNNKQMLQIERENLSNKYNRTLITYKNMPSLQDLENKHIEVEKLFSRGLVSISMAIESHRQQVDFLKSLFDMENDLLVTYKNINLIDGDLHSFNKLLN
ncbi:MAG: hypothetical protein CME71_12585 [Halobacteriovorax sp.]|nr:hypothetical protein [Halobacteriovorax sp.]|tara:strand:+ start:44 stop:1270 length:1227 start_codon:yes stop_codon:yes gene_type:complete